LEPGLGTRHIMTSFCLRDKLNIVVRVAAKLNNLTCYSSLYIHYTIATLYFGETGVCSVCCQKLVIAQKYSVEVRPNFGTRSAPSAKTSALAKHYKGNVQCTSTV